MTAPTIDCRTNGPYLVKGLEVVYDSRSRKLPLPPGGVALCRCGGSANKPFCDGTHGRIGFTDENTAEAAMNRRLSYAHRRITIHDNRGVCAHAGLCTDGLKSVFRLGEEPWIDPAGASIEEIVRTIEKCPSGALSYSLDNVEHRDRDREPMVTVTQNGPYAVTGGIELVGAKFGEGASTEHYTLCRCGGSRNKPFCDGTHWSIGFRDESNA